MTMRPPLHSAKRFAFPGLVLLGVAILLPGSLVAELSAIKVIAPIDTFTGSLDSWVSRSGGNVQVGLSTETNVADSARRTLAISFKRKNPADDNAASNYFHIRRQLKDIPRDAEGIKLTLSADEVQPVYLTVGVLGGVWWKGYGSGPLQPSRIGPESTDYLIPLSSLNDGKTSFNPAGEIIVGFTLTGRAPMGTVHVQEVGFYKKLDIKGWVSVSAEAGNPSGIFERGAPLTFTVKADARPMPDVNGLKYTVCDYYGVEVAAGLFPLGNGNTSTLTLPELPTGYYELSTYPAREGNPISSVPCLKTRGTTPLGCLPFAVMPATIAENIDRIKAVGPDKAFFGIHNMRYQYKLHELMCFPWAMIQPRWNYAEPKGRPDRPNGEPAEWAKNAMAKGSVFPAYLFAFNSFNPNHWEAIPAWAQTSPDQAPCFRWDDFLPFAADEIRIGAALLPHQQHRIVEGTWEINLNRPPYAQKPVYSDQAIVDHFKHFTPLVKSVDREARVIGPTIFAAPDFVSRLADLGFLEFVDGLSLHCYTGDPETLPMSLAALRKVMADHGKPLPIYNTEAGYTSVVGGVQRVKEQARKHVRQNIILKGEGVVAHLTFYPFDYGREQEGTYGLCFSLDDRLGFGPVALAPKPAVPALAVCANQLMGADPVGSLHDWGDQFYGYAFVRDGNPVLALWTTGPDRLLHLPVGFRDKITVTDFMGRKSSVGAVDGIADLSISGEPLYVTGVPSEMYGAPISALLRVYPGGTLDISLSERMSQAEGWGVGVTLASGKATVKVPSLLAAGPRAILFKDRAGHALVRWLVVEPAAELMDCRPAQQGSTLGLQLRLLNHAVAMVPVAVRTTIRGTGAWNSKTVELAPSGEMTVFVPLTDSSKPVDPRDSLEVSVELTINRSDIIRFDKRLSFLCATRAENSRTMAPFSNTVRLEGAGSSGASDAADIAFSWDDQQLHLVVTCHDDVWCQPFDNGETWRGDSIQLAYDTEPDSERLYNPLAGAFSKKVTELCVSKTSSGTVVWRHISHNQQELPIGKAQGWDVSWVRDEAAKVTRISMGIPWTEIGLAGTPKVGQQLGFAALINDLDGDKMTRKCLKLFNGINDDVKTYKSFGRVTLQ